MKYRRAERKHEDNIRAQLVKKCGKEGIHIVLEYGYENCRFDAVVIRNNEVLAIIEVKNWEDNKTASKKTAKIPVQFEKYLKFGIPVYILWHFEGTKSLLGHLKSAVRLFDDRKTISKPHLVYFPRIKPLRKRKLNPCQQLQRLIKEQVRDNLYNFRVYDNHSC